jgi:hypothetical protein
VLNCCTFEKGRKERGKEWRSEKRSAHVGNSNNIVTDLRKAFLGNGSVNTFQRSTMEDVSQWTNIVARF